MTRSGPTAGVGAGRGYPPALMGWFVFCAVLWVLAVLALIVVLRGVR